MALMFYYLFALMFFLSLFFIFYDDLVGVMGLWVRMRDMWPLCSNLAMCLVVD